MEAAFAVHWSEMSIFFYQDSRLIIAFGVMANDLSNTLKFTYSVWFGLTLLLTILQLFGMLRLNGCRNNCLQL
jgi:hypothetical protein